MIKYYLRPDQAHIRIDEENKVATNVLTLGVHKFIGHITDVNYVNNMINMANSGSLIPSDETAFNTVLDEAKAFINNI